MHPRNAFLAAFLAGAGTVAFAHDLRQHPAVITASRQPTVAPSTYIVGHPASPHWGRGHSNADHPAVLAHRSATDSRIDTNTYLVQPPAHAEWRAMEGVNANLEASIAPQVRQPSPTSSSHL